MIHLLHVVVCSLIGFVGAPPAFDELPVRLQNFLNTESQNFGIDGNGRLFCRSSELMYRRVLSEARDADRVWIDQLGWVPGFNESRDTDAWKLSNRDTVSSDPPPLWVYADGKGPNRLLLLQGEGKHLSYIRLVQVLGNGEALFRARYRGSVDESDQLKHVTGLPDGLIDDQQLAEEGYLVEHDSSFVYTDTRGAQRTVKSFVYLKVADTRITGDELYEAYLADEVIPLKHFYRVRRPNRDERDSGVESAFEWSLREIKFVVLDRFIAQQEK